MSSRYRVFEAHSINHFILPNSQFVWQVSQLTGGDFYSKSEAFYHDHIDIYRNFTNQTLQEVRELPSSINTCCLHDQENSFYMKESYYGEGGISFASGGNIYEAITKKDSTHFTIKMNDDHLPDYLTHNQKTLINDFFRKKRDVTYCEDGCHLELQKIISDLFDKLSYVKTGTIENTDWLENTIRNIFDTMLCLVTNAKLGQLRKNSSGYLLDKAVSLIGQCADPSIEVSDLANRLHTNRRNLELAFNTYLNLSPKEYINNLRLNNVRRRLFTANKNTNSVSTVARSFGFNHLGNFSQAYKKLFNEYPSQTLAHSPITVVENN